MSTDTIIRVFTIGSLGGLLLAVGLRLTFSQVSEAIKGCRFALILVLNFVAVPVLCAVAAKLSGFKAHEAAAMVLLGAAPFAPVVPVFARMARADLPLAAGLTSIYPVISALLTPWVCSVLLKRAAHTQELSFPPAM
jgi:BASS family bile acid:Na+ symporter